MVSEFGSLLNAELLATCNSLGVYNGKTYEPDPYCLESLKDLIRFLRKDDEYHEIRRQLGTIQVLQNDLLPILKFQSNKTDLFDVTLRFLVNLTTPPLLIYKEEIPTDKASRNHYMEMLSHAQSYKKAFTDVDLWVVLTTKLAPLLKKEYEDRVEDDTLTMERILVLVRNILHIPADFEAERRTDDDVSLHDQILWALYMSGFKDLLIYITTSTNESQFYLHILEIISLMVREQTPEQLVQAGKIRSEAEKQRDMEALLRTRREEVERKQHAQKKYSRFSRFSGTFYVKDVKSISDRDLIAHKMVDTVKDLDFDRTKNIRRKPKNRRPVEEAQVVRKSTLSIRVFLKNFCLEFIANAYNPFMDEVRRLADRPAGVHTHDETYFLWAMRFFMELNRLEGQQMALVSETMSIANFHYVLTHLETSYEMMVTDKKKAGLWARRMYTGLQAYKELVMTLQAMDSSSEENVRRNADVIKRNIFYLMEYRDLLITLINSYDQSKLSKSYLADLVETIHVFMRMLERYCRGHSRLVVQQKAIHPKKKKSKGGAISQLTLDDRWTQVSNSLSELLVSPEEFSTEMSAFDAGSDKTEDQMREEAKQKIRMCLRRNQLNDSLALIKMSRDLWPDDSAFGTPDCAPEDELLSLREIFFLPGPEEDHPDGLNKDEEDESDDDNEELDEEMNAARREQVFNFEKFVARFASPKVLQNYCLLLRRYRLNSEKVNHAVVKLLHRVAWDQSLPALLFQASAFRTFQSLLAEKTAVSPSVKELQRFAIFVISKFVDAARTNDKILMELLFWKKAPEAMAIHAGDYSTKKKPVKVLWSEEQNAELDRLYHEYKDVREEGKDVVDQVTQHLIDQSKTRLQVLKQLRYLGLMTKASNVRLKNLPWEPEHEEELRELFSRFRESTDIVTQVQEHLSVRRGRKHVVDKILELGLVADRKQLWKKKASQSTGRSRKKSTEEDDEEDHRPSRSFIASDEEESSSDDNDAPQAVAPELPKDPSALNALLAGVATDPTTRPALPWLIESLDEAATERGQGDDEPVPLVPLTEAHDSALATPALSNALQALGLAQPHVGQEAYWRIPGNLTVYALKVRAGLLRNALLADARMAASSTATSGRTEPFALTDSELDQSTAETRNGDIQQDQRPLTQTGNPSSQVQISESSQPGSEEEESEDDGVSTSRSQKVQRKVRLVESDEDEGVATHHRSPSPDVRHSAVSDEDQPSEGTVSKRRRRALRRVVESDSSEEESRPQTKRPCLQDSEDED